MLSNVVGINKSNSTVVVGEGDAQEMPAAKAADPSAEHKERLIAAVKKEVKQLMEEVRNHFL